MKAFLINWSLSWRVLEVDIVPAHFLPDVSCASCGEEWCAPWFSFPAINPPWIDEFPFEEEGDKPVVAWEDFLRLRQRLKRWDREVAEVVPGAAIGCLSGTSSRRDFPEFFCDGDDIILSSKCLQNLQKHGLQEPFAPISISCRGRPIKDRFCIQPRILNAVAPDQRQELVRRECSVCGFLDLNPSFGNNLRSTYWFLRRAAVRRAPNFFVVRETGVLVFTERFLRLLEGLNVLNNLEIVHCGDFV